MWQLALAALFNVGLNVFFKLASEASSPKKFLLLGVGLALGGGYAFFFARALEKLDLGLAYPVFAGASVVLTMIVGFTLFGESFVWTKGVGAALIVAGIAVAYA
jgi:multidrug transporter EmrE-like cation transporter